MLVSKLAGTRSAKRKESEAGHSRRVGGRFNKGAYLRVLSSVSSTAAGLRTTQNFKISVEAFSHVTNQGGLNNSSLKTGVLESAPTLGTAASGGRG